MGDNAESQAGFESKAATTIQEPTLVPFFNNHEIVKICGGVSHSVVLTKQGEVFVAGSNTLNQIGLGEDSTAATWTQILKEHACTDVGCGNYHSVFLTSTLL